MNAPATIAHGTPADLPARLIAAAPHMLAVLESSAADVAEMTNWPDDQLRGWAYAVARNAQAAIAKAHGEQREHL